MSRKVYRFPCGCTFDVLQESSDPAVLPLLDFDIERIPDSCPATWQMLGRGDTKGVFQLESSLGRQWTRRLKPESDEHMGALGALLRPGPLMGVDDEGVSLTEHYVRRKNGLEPVENFHPALAPILETTYGVLTYQEQSMRIARDLAGFDLVAVDRLRKGIAKKDQKLLASLGEEFKAGCRKVGVLDEETIDKIWEWIRATGRYQFNKCSHADTVIRRASRTRFSKGRGHTIGHLYKLVNDIEYARTHGHLVLRRKLRRQGNYGQGLSMCKDGRVRPNTIKDIRPMGKEPVVRIVLADGRSMKVTVNHKFPTSRGEMMAAMIAAHLAMGKEISLYVCQPYEKTSKTYAFSGVTNEQRRLKTGRSGRGTAGPENRWYTNGSFSEFEKVRETLPDVCESCNQKGGRLELHHLDGDRSNSSRDNLQLLCPSCHKKQEYAAGRTKRGEKGYPTALVQVVRVEDAGEAEVYDVEMAAPYHNFVTGEDIVTCNSHSTCYGLRGYKTAYIKAHFPVAFFASWLKHADSKPDPRQEVAELVSEARLFDVCVEPPDLRTLQADVQTDGKVVKFGLASIKGVGRAQVVKLREAVAEGERVLGKPLASWTWLEHLVFVAGGVSSSTMEKFVEAGAVRYLGMQRQQQLAELRAWNSLTEKEQGWIIQHQQFASLADALEALGRPRYRKPARKSDPEPEGPFGGCASDRREEVVRSQAYMLRNPATPLVDTPLWLSWIEEQLLGISLTASRVDSCDLSAVTCTCKEFLSGKTGHLVLGVVVQQVREVRTKKGKSAGSKMAFLTLDDGSCALSDVVVFPEVWREHGHIMTEGAMVILQGERDQKNKDQLVVKKVWEAAQAGFQV